MDEWTSGHHHRHHHRLSSAPKLCEGIVKTLSTFLIIYCQKEKEREREREGEKEMLKESWG